LFFPPSPKKYFWRFNLETGEVIYLVGAKKALETHEPTYH
jgi:hypothetical protein